MKQLYDNTVLTDENYDNAMRKANAKLTDAMQNAYTNRANTANLNSIYPQFDIDPASGGMIDITDPKAFYADPNYQDPQSHLDNYTETIDKLRKANVPEGYTGDTAGRNKHLANAALNATAMIPGVGQIATATKAGKTVAAATKAKTLSKTAGLVGDDVASTAANVGGKFKGVPPLLCLLPAILYNSNVPSVFKSVKAVSPFSASTLA